jgi:hypothetical protein
LKSKVLWHLEHMTAKRMIQKKEAKQEETAHEKIRTKPTKNGRQRCRTKIVRRTKGIENRRMPSKHGIKKDQHEEDTQSQRQKDTLLVQRQKDTLLVNPNNKQSQRKSSKETGGEDPKYQCRTKRRAKRRANAEPAWSKCRASVKLRYTRADQGPCK